jgi:conjugal transfer pilus assembly protein TraF
MRIPKANNRFCKTIILVNFTLFPLLSPAQTFFSDKNQGWFFYESKPVESVEALPSTTKPVQIQTPGQKAESELNALKSELNQASALALLYPTPENVWAYQQLKSKVYNMAGVLTDQQVRNEWTRPDSYAATHATGGEGLENDRRDQNHCTENLLRDGANKYGLFLFIGSNCKYCNSQIKVAQEAQRNYGLSGMVIGFNGFKPNVDIGGLNYGADNGALATKFNIRNEGTPVSILYDTASGQSQIIGYGYVPLDNLNNRICRLYTKKLGEF